MFFITSQHFIYGLTLRRFVSTLHVKYRLPIGFLLTDELFALSSKEDRIHVLSVSYLLGAVITFYVGWVAFSLMGMVTPILPNLNRYHLDFSIIAMFITIVVPMIKHLSALSGVVSSLLLSMLLTYFDVEGAIVSMGYFGMMISVFVSRIAREQK